jgi:outer membrane murein-binding lipoprotein Lpp
MAALVRSLAARVDKLEKQVAALVKAKKPAPGPARGYRDSFDTLDYPER